MDFKYEYIDPISKGFKRIKVSRNNHNEVFKYRKRSFLKDLMNTVEYYENDECIQMQNVPSLFGKIVILIVSPLLILFYGIGNKEIYTEIKRTLFAKKHGAFTSDCVYNKEQIKVLKGIERYWMINWKPIESAPKDGTIIIVKSGVGSVHSVTWETYRGKTSWFDFSKGWIPSANYWTEYN